MADYDSSLPVRTENAGDVIAKIADATTPTDQLKVESNGSINVNAQGGSFVVTATNLDIRDLVFATDKVDASGSEVSLDAGTLAALESITVQNGAGAAAVNIQDGGNSITVDATDLDIRDLAFATDKVDVTGSEVSLDAGTLAALESITVQNGAGGAAVNIQDGGNSITVDATDLDIRDLAAATDSVAAWISDATGAAFSNTNPLPVSLSPSAGDEVNDYKLAAAVAGGASDNHDYTVTAATTLNLMQVVGSGSGKAKMEVKVETGVATNTFTTYATFFNSTSDPNMEWKLSAPIAVAAGVRVRVTMTNRDNQSQDLYSTISGIEE
jgi:hypothetical protein